MRVEALTQYLKTVAGHKNETLYPVLKKKKKKKVNGTEVEFPTLSKQAHSN